ncbi:hypothetical protein Tco_0917041, partial [Tanacetum coccineum]
VYPAQSHSAGVGIATAAGRFGSLALPLAAAAMTDGKHKTPAIAWARVGRVQLNFRKLHTAKKNFDKALANKDLVRLVTFPRLPGRHVAGDTHPGRHVARDNLKGKARQGFFPG